MSMVSSSCSRLKGLKCIIFFPWKQSKPGHNRLDCKYNLSTQILSLCCSGWHAQQNIKRCSTNVSTFEYSSCREEVSRNQWEHFISQSLPPAARARTAAFIRIGKNDKFISTSPSCAADWKSQKQALAEKTVIREHVYILVTWHLRMYFLYFNELCSRQIGIGEEQVVLQVRVRRTATYLSLWYSLGRCSSCSWDHWTNREKGQSEMSSALRACWLATIKSLAVPRILLLGFRFQSTSLLRVFPLRSKSKRLCFYTKWG